MKRSSSPQEHPPSNGTPKLEITRHDIDGQHWYLIQDIVLGTREWFDSVTKYTGHYPKGPEFYRWFANQGGFDKAEQAKEDGGDRGNNVHASTLTLAGGKEIYLADHTVEEWKHLLSAKNWFKEFGPQVVAMEEIVYSLRNRIAGTLDLRCVIGGKEGIVDFKTSKHIYRSHEIQSNEYAHMARENGRPVEFAAVLRTGTKHKRGFEYKQWDICEETHGLFEALLKIGRDFDPSTEPHIPSYPDKLSL